MLAQQHPYGLTPEQLAAIYGGCAPIYGVASLGPRGQTPPTLPPGFPLWLRTMHADNTGSARDVLAQVAARLDIALDREGN